MSVGVPVGDCVGVFVGDAVGVFVGLTVGVTVGVGVAVLSGAQAFAKDAATCPTPLCWVPERVHLTSTWLANCTDIRLPAARAPPDGASS